MTVCMQTYLKLNAFSCRTLFSETFGIPDELLQDLDTGDGKFLNNLGLAAIDAKDSAYMNDEGLYLLLRTLVNYKICFAY